MADANVMAGASEQKQTDLSGGGSLASLARSVPASSTMELLHAKEAKFSLSPDTAPSITELMGEVSRRTCNRSLLSARKTAKI